MNVFKNYPGIEFFPFAIGLETRLILDSTSGGLLQQYSRLVSTLFRNRPTTEPSMKTLLLVVTMCVLATSCRRHPTVATITKMPGDIVYERLEDIADGARVLTLNVQETPKAGYIIIPGDVLWCEFRENLIIGEKVALPRPAYWMDANWERSGFFIVNLSAINHRLPYTEKSFSTAIKWFTTKEELEEEVEAHFRR